MKGFNFIDKAVEKHFVDYFWLTMPTSLRLGSFMNSLLSNLPTNLTEIQNISLYFVRHLTSLNHSIFFCNL